MSCDFELGEPLHLTNDGGIYRIINHNYNKHTKIPNIAVKLIDPSENTNYKKEIIITKIASDSEISPKVFDSCTVKLDGKLMYGLVFEYLDNAKTLDYILNDKKLNKRIVSEIKILLDVMYNNGIIHNDLHGENVLFNKSGRPYLIDFGMSELKKQRIPSNKRDYIIELSGPGYPVILNLKDETLTKIVFNRRTFKTTEEVFDIKD